MGRPKIYTEEQYRQRRRESSLKWVRKNKEHANENSRIWAKNNPEKTKVNNHRRYNNMKDVPVFRIRRLWGLMIDRCYNKKNKSYQRYGGRGIIICNEWKYNKTAFVNWALENNYQLGLTIERKNNDGNYAPDNCVFATKKQQNNNRSDNKTITYQGKIKTLAQWAEYFKIPKSTFWNRVKNGSPIEDIFYPNHLQSHKPLSMII
jgi:hypothetical protein